MATLRFSVSTEDDGERLDKLVAKAGKVSRRIARTWIAAGRVRVNDKPMRILTRPLRAGAQIVVDAEETTSAAPSADASPALTVLFCDKDLVVVDKPPKLLSEHDRFGSPSLESVVPALLRARGERESDVWLVHRLDAGTSGVIVLARTRAAVQRLSDDFRDGRVKKTYWAAVTGRFSGERTIDAPIARAERTRHMVSAAGKPALTVVRELASSSHASLIEARPKTGRTHQIRVHMTHVGHPLLGDRLYGGPTYTSEGKPSPIPRAMLHARALELTHPRTGERRVFTAPLPADFVALLMRLQLPSPEEAS